jgi:hypothetical protein
LILTSQSTLDAVVDLKPQFVSQLIVQDKLVEILVREVSNPQVLTPPAVDASELLSILCQVADESSRIQFGRVALRHLISIVSVF